MITKQKMFRVGVGVLLFALILLGISLIPTLWLNTKNMSEFNGNWVKIFYGTEEAAAKDVFNLAEAKAGELSDKLGFTTKQDIIIYIYDDQYTFQTKKYGLIAPLLGLDWYVGDNRGANVLLTSPARPGSVHDYENNKQVALHEMVHAYNSILNPHMPLWLNEGVALYLTNGNPPDDLYRAYYSGIPTFEQIQKTNPIAFSNMGGYDFAHTYIEYLDKTYGWDKVLTLLKTMDYEAVFAQNAEGIYDGWVEFLKINYNP